MSKAHRRTFVLAALIAGLSMPALAQQPPNQPPQKKGPVQGQVHQGGPPGPPGHAAVIQGGPAHVGGPPGGPQHPVAGPAAAQFRGPAGAGQFRDARHPDAVRVVHPIGERGYSFRTGFAGRRELVTFSPQERTLWLGGRWRHERHFGRMGYWWEVNGVWYYYDQPLAGPPTYVSDVEFADEDIDPDAGLVVGAPPAVVVAPPAVVVAPPVIVAPRPVYVAPPVVCVGPLCVR